MTSEKISADRAAELRRRAEERLKGKKRGRRSAASDNPFLL